MKRSPFRRVDRTQYRRNLIREALVGVPTIPTLSPKACRSISITEPAAEQDSSGLGPPPGPAGESASGGGPPGQLQSQGLKCVMPTRHKVWPGA